MNDVPEVAFHFGASDKLEYTCRLLRKAVASGARLVVVAQDPVLQQLDAALWAISPTDFLPHSLAVAQQSMQGYGPIILATDAAQQESHRQVLVNLAPEVPQGFESYKRVIEVVSANEHDRSEARRRWKHYTDAGYSIQRHDLNSLGSVNAAS